MLVVALSIAVPVSDARADTVHLPIAGLVVELADTWSVAGTWSPSDDPREPARGEDVLTRADGLVVYHVRTGGRTDRPCPLDAPFVVELDELAWIHDPVARTLCRLETDARIEVTIARGPPEPEAHRAELAALAEALGRRRVDPDAPPPLRDPRVTHRGARTPMALPLDTIGLSPRAPDDGYVWRVAEPRADRHYDALVRVVPTFPEVQLLVYRHHARHLATCGDLYRRQAARTIWRVDHRGGTLVRDLGRFRVVDHCTEHPGGLLEVRIATAPHAATGPLEPMLAALATAAREAPLPPLPPLVPARTHTMRWAAGAAGFALPDDGSRPLVGVELGLTFVQRNGFFLRAMAAAGTSDDEAWASGAFDVGVALGADPSLTLALALGLREDDDPIIENRSLSMSLELHSNMHRDDMFGWALRVVPFHLASRQPSVAGTPLVIAFDGVFASGLMLGLDLRWVDRPPEPVPGWLDSGLVLGVRVGFADLVR